MSYKLEWKPSPNFTPASQTQAFYGQPRIIKFGAGHWWNTPEAGARHDGIVSIFLNPARQAAAHAVVSAGRVTEMVRAKDTAWCTNNANPYTYAIELDPRVMYKWQSASAANKKLANEIFETVAEYIADKGYHNMAWYPHKKWFSTQCNPIRWAEIVTRAKQIYAAKHAPKPTVSWVAVEKPRKMQVIRDTYVYELPAVKAVGDILKKGTLVDIASKTSGGSWLRSAYSTSKNLNQGIKAVDMGEVPEEPPKPEWIKNLKDIADVKLMVLNTTAVIYDLNTGKPVGSPIPQKTWVDISKQTVVGGKTYLISKYAADNAMPNGILQSDLGLPAPEPKPPVTPPEPEWVKNWQDIADVDMYTRKANVEVVNLLDGTTTTTIPKMGEKIAIASSTEWMGQKYLITKYSTDKKLPHGIRLVDLDMKPVPPSTEPIPENPNVPVDDLIRENNSLLKQILALLQQIWNKLTGK